MAQRFSHQRERIYQTVLERRDHPTAEMVYQQLKPEMPRLSLGTVYRNLQQMAREGRLAEVDGPVTRFDAVTRPHTHFQCRFCGALMDLGVYNVSYVVGLFGSPNKVHYAANVTRGIDTSGVLTMEYRSFKAVSINAKDSSSPARYIIQGTKGYLLQKSTANFCGGVTFHPYKGKEEHFNLSAGRPRQAAEFHAFARAIESEDMELCSRMLDTSVAVSRVLETARRDAGIRFTTDL